MKIALISDIHGNLVALQAVLKKADALSPDAIVCMGDLVGYGPQPNEVIDIIRASGIARVWRGTTMQPSPAECPWVFSVSRTKRC